MLRPVRTSRRRGVRGIRRDPGRVQRSQDRVHLHVQYLPKAALSDLVEIEYLTTGTYNHATESGVRWNDPALKIKWPVKKPALSAKDAALPFLKDAQL